MDKSEYYLMFAKKVYAFQRNNLLRKSVGVYYDMLGAKGSSLSESGIAYETIDGVRYRANNQEEGPTGTASFIQFRDNAFPAPPTFTG